MPYRHCSWLLLLLVTALGFSGIPSSRADGPVLRPRIDGPWRVIAESPDLSALLPDKNRDPVRDREPNDHHIFRDREGTWHLWACVRETEVGRLLAHWVSPSLDMAPWAFTGDLIRADRNAGESLVAWRNQEFIQSPFIVEHEGRFFMFYGGYATGYDANHEPTIDYASMENQISLMTSPDGRTWTRHRDANGFSRVFVGPGAARDPVVRRFGDRWYLYYTGHHNADVQNEAIYVRTSTDLVQWSDWSIAHFVDPEHRTSRTCESPQVVERGGRYYLFRSGGYRGDGNGTCAVFVSDDPLDFGRSGDGRDHYVCNLPTHAPELIRDGEGREYITRIYSPETGYAIQIAPLRWEPVP